MTDEEEQTKAGVTDLSEEDLKKAQGGFTAPGNVPGVKLVKKADSFNPGVPHPRTRSRWLVRLSAMAPLVDKPGRQHLGLVGLLEKIP